jgi:hypothetical protein
VHHPYEKGTKVNHTERSTRTQSRRTGLFATLGAFLHHPGSSMPSPSPRRRRLALGLLPTALLLLFAAAPTPALALPPHVRFFEMTSYGGEVGATWAYFDTAVFSEGIETQWHIEYAISESGPWSLAVSGVIPPGVNEQEAEVGATYHLTPATHYFARVVASNSSGEAKAMLQFTTTPVAAPEFIPCASLFLGNFSFDEASGGVRNRVCGDAAPAPTSLDLNFAVDAAGAETTYHSEYAPAEEGHEPPENSLSWVSVAGGTVTVAEAFTVGHLDLVGLAPETQYYVRIPASNAKGTTIRKARFITHTVHPEASVSAVSSVTATSVHLNGSVKPNGYETHWYFEYASAEAGPWVPVPGGAGTIPQAEAAYAEAPTLVEADLTGLSPAKVYYARLFSENTSPGTGISTPVSFETAGPPAAETFAVHGIHGEAMRGLGSVFPHGLDTHYHFEYVSEEHFEKSAWAESQSTPALDAGPGSLEGGVVGYPTEFVGQDLSELQPGQTYRYRLLVSNGQGAAEGKEQTLTVPGAPAAPAVESCENERFRTGPSGHLPDCRAYEQVTPLAKEGAVEPFRGLGEDMGSVVGQDGEHLMIESKLTKWGHGQGPYFFARNPERGWQMTAGAPQPQTGIANYYSKVFSPDLTHVGLYAEWQTNPTSTGDSPAIEYKAGPPGGPYTLVASVPRAERNGNAGDGWVAASADFSKLILAFEDRTLAGHPTATKSGSDLYEYSGEELRQANVDSAGKTIGSCGAEIAAFALHNTLTSASPHRVSADGSRVFFEAVPGASCSEPKHLFMREGAAKTLDLGAYQFVVADAQGSRLLLEKHSGETHEYFLYDVASATAKLLFSAHGEVDSTALQVSEDFTAVYFRTHDRLTPEAPPVSLLGSQGNLYRYDISTGTLRFLVRGAQGSSYSPSPDGRYDYFLSEGVGGLPGTNVHHSLGQTEEDKQLYRYDSAESVVECVSCASPFDPEPNLGVNNTGGATTVNLAVPDGQPKLNYTSANGDYAFFTTDSALVPRDLNGEIIEEKRNPSSDVYEWRRVGVDGCVHLQGCLSLISSGTDGGLVALLGATESGRDVFFFTRSSLLPRDNDTAGDVYDARIGGGFPEPARPVECEGDACSTPFAAPSDLTPSSSTFHGAGNLLGATLPEVKKPTSKTKVKCKAKAKKKCKAKHKKKAQKIKKSNHRRGK